MHNELDTSQDKAVKSRRVNSDPWEYCGIRPHGKNMFPNKLNGLKN